MSDKSRDALACLLLRFGLGWFIFVWAVNKILAPQQYQQLARHFDSLDLGQAQVLGIAALQIALCLMVFAGWKRIFSYAGLFAIHAYTVSRQWEKYIAPFEINEHGFPINRNVTDSLAVLFAMAALWLFRHRDHWSLDMRLRR